MEIEYSKAHKYYEGKLVAACNQQYFWTLDYWI